MRKREGDPDGSPFFFRCWSYPFVLAVEGLERILDTLGPDGPTRQLVQFLVGVDAGQLFVELSFQSILVPVLPRDREDTGALVLVPLQDGHVAMAGELGADSTILLLIL